MVGGRFNWIFGFGGPERFAQGVRLAQIDIEPEEYVRYDGEVVQKLSRTVIRFVDENQEQVARKYGSRLRMADAPEKGSETEQEQSGALKDIFSTNDWGCV